MKRQRAIGWSVGAIMVVALVVYFISRSSGSIPYVPPGEAQRPPMKGSLSASVTVEEFSDFQCPACKSAESVVKDLLATFGDRIFFQYRNYPLVTIHTQAFRAALAAECALDQDKFWEYSDKLFEKQPDFSRNELVQYATDLGLTIEGESGFAACLDSRFYTETIRADMKEGDKRNIQGTPTFFVNGEQVQDWSTLKEIIQGKLLGG